MKDIESTIRRMELENEDSGVQVFSNNNTEQTIYTKDIESSESDKTTEETGNTTEIGDTTETSGTTETASATNTSEDAEAGSTQAQQETIATDKSKDYTIEEGDTLMSISLKNVQFTELCRRINESKWHQRRRHNLSR